MNNQEAIQELIAFYGYYAGELREECSMAISALEKQINNGWIPVSERLPIQEDGRGIWVLTCATSGLIESNHFCNGRFYDADKNGYKITAWQSLPEPWKDESE